MDAHSILIMNWRDTHNPDAGGAEVYLHEMARRWVQWGHEVSLITAQFAGAPREETVDGVRVVRTGDRYSVYRRARRTYLERFRKQCDVVLDSINTKPFATPRYVNERASIHALIYQLAREYWFYETPLPVALVGRYVLEEHWLNQYAEVATTTISASTRDDLVRLGFRNVEVIHAGVSTKPLKSLPAKEDVPTLIFVGRLKKAKLPHHALESFRIVRSRLPQARLWIVGGGYMMNRLQRSAPPGVEFFGRIPEAQKVDLMKRAHVLLFPAVREGWGLSVIEANAVGTPAIGYDVPGLRDAIVDGRTGSLVASGDMAEMANESVRLLLNESEWSKIAREALEYSRGFDWDNTASQFLKRLAS